MRKTRKSQGGSKTENPRQGAKTSLKYCSVLAAHLSTRLGAHFFQAFLFTDATVHMASDNAGAAAGTPPGDAASDSKKQTPVYPVRLLVRSAAGGPGVVVVAESTTQIRFVESESIWVNEAHSCGPSLRNIHLPQRSNLGSVCCNSEDSASLQQAGHRERKAEMRWGHDSGDCRV